MAFVTPFAFASRLMMVRRLTQPSIGFNNVRLFMSSLIICNTVVILLGLIYWRYYSFNYQVFWYGFFGGIFDVAAILCVYQAIMRGPGGPICGVVDTC